MSIYLAKIFKGIRIKWAASESPEGLCITRSRLKSPEVA